MAALSLTSSELAELDHFLISGETSSSIMALDTLHGYLTAIAIAPTDTPPERWIGYIYDGRGDSSPNVPDPASEEQRIDSYLKRLLEDILTALSDPDYFFSPLVMTRTFRRKQYADGEMWCYGFLQGIALNHGAWADFLVCPTGRRLLQPIHLLGSDRVTAEEEALASTPSQRARLTAAIPAAVRAISDYFLEIELTRLLEHENNPHTDTANWLH